MLPDGTMNEDLLGYVYSHSSSEYVIHSVSTRDGKRLHLHHRGEPKVHAANT